MASASNFLRVLAPGLLTTIQDLGRYGYERFGLPVAGALDDFALRWANLLVGNEPGAAALEATLVGPTLVYEGDTPLLAAMSGADCEVMLDDRSLALWRSFRIDPGDTITLGTCQRGARIYLAIQGGIGVPAALGSRSTDLMGHIGGIEGRVLRAGDEVPAGTPTAAAQEPQSLLTLPVGLVPRYADEVSVRVVLGPQQDRFTEAALATFLSATYTVTPRTDRMGMRLAGPALVFAPGTPGPDILSEGIVTGAIQVPAHGQPIILLAGHQTTGGYAKIATVIGADLWRLGQARPGNCLRFQAVSVAEAQDARREYMASFDPARLVPVHEPISSSPAPIWTPHHEDELIKRAGSLGITEESLRDDYDGRG